MKYYIYAIRVMKTLRHNVAIKKLNEIGYYNKKGGGLENS